MLFESAVRSNLQLIPYGIMNPSSEAPLIAAFDSAAQGLKKFAAQSIKNLRSTGTQHRALKIYFTFEKPYAKISSRETISYTLFSARRRKPLMSRREKYNA